MDTDDVTFVYPSENSEDEGLDQENKPSVSDPDPGTSVVVVSRRTVIIEPVLAMFVAAFLPSYTLISQLVYAIQADYNNLTSALGMHGDSNNTDTCSDYLPVGQGDYLKHLEAYVQSESAKFLTLLDVSSQLPAMVLVILYGAYSDRVGRKLPMVLPLLGQLLKCSVYMVTIKYRLSLYLLTAANIVEGLTGSLPTMFMSCYAYLSQISHIDKRTTRLTIIDVTCGVCGSISQVLMGFAISHMGYMWPFIMVIGLHVINLTYVMFFVPELNKERQRNISLTQDLTRGLKLYITNDEHGVVWQRWLLLIATLCCNTLAVARWVPITLYCMNYPLCWNSILIGIYVAWTSICCQMGQIGLVATLQKKLRDAGLAIIGCISGVAYFLLLAFCASTLSMFLVAPVGSGSFVPTIMLRVINSKLAPEDSQGAMFSVLSVLDIICQLVGSLVFNLIYGATQLIMTSLVFFVMSGLQLVGMIIIIIYLLKSGNTREQEYIAGQRPSVPYETLT